MIKITFSCKYFKLDMMQPCSIYLYEEQLAFLEKEITYHEFISEY